MSEAIHPTEQEEVMAYLDGELNADHAAAMAAHLRECADCESLAASLRSVSRQLAAWTAETSPAGLNGRIYDAARSHVGLNAPHKPFRQKDTESFWFGRKRWAVFALAAVSAVILVLVVGVPVLYRSRDAVERTAQRVSGLSAPADEYRYSPRTLERKVQVPAAEDADGVEGRLSDGSLEEEEAVDSNGLHHPRGQHAQTTFSVDGAPAPDQPFIARTASLTLVVKDFGPIEASVKAIAERYRGYIANLNTTSPQNAAREFTATLKIPAGQLEAAIAELKQLGRVEHQEQSGEDVTKQYTDVAAHLKNSRITEQRLLDVLRDRTGKMKDILETEQEIERVRGEIEELESAQRGLQKRIEFATVQLSVTENYKASLEVAPPSTGTRFHNAAVSGLLSVVDGTIGFALWLLEAGPSLLLWAALLFFPARWAWRRWRRLLLEGTAAVPQQ